MATSDWRSAVSRDEIQALTRLRPWRSWLSLATNWGLIALAFALVARWPNPATIVCALAILGGRQLGLAVLMHEAAHRTLFRHRGLNDWIGNWLCAYPVWGDVHPYRRYHLQHHAHTWTAADPDLGLATPFPVTRASFRRKVWRDLSGQTGWKRLRATLARDLGRSRGRVLRERGAGPGALVGVIVSNAALAGILALLGHPALYLLWVAAWFTTYSLAMRIRAIAEHAVPRDPATELGQTRTTRARWWERLLVAPNRVNFHLEHHLLPTVPHYALPRLHRLLRERGVLETACLADGYRAVLAAATARAA